MLDNEYVLVKAEKYLELINDSSKLCMLECGGVDDWEDYSEVLYPENDYNLDDERCENRNCVEHLQKYDENGNKL